MRTTLTVGDRVKEKNSCGIGVIVEISGEFLDTYAVIGKGLSKFAWYGPDELILIELATDASIEEGAKMLCAVRVEEEEDK